MTDRPEPLRDLDWGPERARAFTDRTADLLEELLQRLRDLPVTNRVTIPDVRGAVAIDVPEEPMPQDALISYLHDMVFERSMYPGHPRFMAYVSGAGTIPGAAADLLAAGVNMNAGGWLLSPSTSEIERHLTATFARWFGMPSEAGGILVSGGAMANFVALKVARDRHAGWDVRSEGVAGHPQLAIYLSTETHVVSSRAADMLGLGTGAARKIPVDADFRIRVEELRAAIRRDRDAGVRPIAVVGSAGTVATGAVDPLETLADLCADEGLWFHVDAAYGGPAAFTEDLAPLFAGIHRADSIAFDPHKWLYTPLSGGCVLVRDLQFLSDSFSVTATYVHQDKERTGRGVDGSQLGPEFSRSNQSLKVWVSLLAHGRRAYVTRISHDAALARYLGARAEERPDFELVTPVGLSICCFRYVPPGLPDHRDREPYLSLLNERLMTEAQLDGRTFFSNAVLDDRFVLRACIVNFRTEADDLDATLDVAAEIGGRLDAELRPAELGGGVTQHVLGLLGSGEFQPWAGEVDLALLDRARTGDGRALVLPTASAPEGREVFERWAAMGLAHYQRLGVTAELVPLRTREDAEDPELVARLSEASLVFFSGGNPAYLTVTLTGTAFWAAVLEGMGRGLAYGGCSAGVQCLGDRALDAAAGTFGPEVWKSGLGLFGGVWFGPHWDALDRYVPGLSGFIRGSVPPGDLLVAIDEDTAMIGDGRGWEVLGSGSVHLSCDGTWTDHPAGTRFTQVLGSGTAEPADPER